MELLQLLILYYLPAQSGMNHVGTTDNGTATATPGSKILRDGTAVDHETLITQNTIGRSTVSSETNPVKILCKKRATTTSTF